MQLWAAERNGEVLALVWVAWDDDQAYYLGGGRHPEVHDPSAMTALLWQAILEAKAQGLGRFDFEGSMDPGVERFFQAFGGEKNLYVVARQSRSLWWNWLDFLRKS